MYIIDRGAAIIRPQKSMLEWINNHPDSEKEKLTLEDIQEDLTVILIPDFDTKGEAEAYIRKIYKSIFEQELDSWYTDKENWPEIRDYETFKSWFDVELYSTILDPSEEVILKEPYELLSDLKDM